MSQVKLGPTGITVHKNGFGALPIQRVSDDEAVYLLRKAYSKGVRFFDTARNYTDSEKKIGLAFKGMRENVYISSKTKCDKSVEKFWSDLETTLENLQTNYLDIYQFHNPDFCPKPGDGTGLYEAMLEAKKIGKINHIGITNHSLNIAQEAIESRLYETLQFPFSYIATKDDIKLVENCKEANMGFIAMKSLAGGLITNVSAAYAFLNQYDHVLAIWGIQKEVELDQFMVFMEKEPVLNGTLLSEIDRDKEVLSKNFCRGCGYCMPCPVNIVINECARMSLLIRRAPIKKFLVPEIQEQMMNIKNCLKCNKCVNNCPYNLDTPKLLEANYEDYMEILAGETLL